jgi:cytochrome c-type biogenesis protein CcmH/NrfF
MKWYDWLPGSEWIPVYGLWYEVLRRKPTEFEKLVKLLSKIRKKMKKGLSNNDIRHWLITTRQPVSRIWIHDKPNRRITIMVENEHNDIYFFGYVIERNGKFIDLIPRLNQL